MALLVSLVLMLLLGLLGLSSMQGATQHERLAGLQVAGLEAFESAEAALVAGELKTDRVAACGFCLPPPEATRVTAAGIQAGDSSGLPWVAGAGGFHLVQNLGVTQRAKGLPAGTPATLYRITAVGREGEVVSVIESIVAAPVQPGDFKAGRIAWRQIH